jgi:hypothetical protein
MVEPLTSFEDDKNPFNYEVSDESLETAGEYQLFGNYTLGACSGLSVCPA